MTLEVRRAKKNRDSNSFPFALALALALALSPLSLSRFLRGALRDPPRICSSLTLQRPPMLQLPEIPKCCRKSRSRAARPSPRQGSSVDISNCKGSSSSTITASTYQGSDDPVSGNKEEMLEFSLFRCNMPRSEKHKGIILKSIEEHAIEVDSVIENAFLDSSENRSRGPQLSHHDSIHSMVGSLPSTPDKSTLPASERADAWLAPGNVVWAKSTYHEWWPAEVMAERNVLECSNDHHIGHVLVQLYGGHECAWLNPVGDLSPFDHCYEERSKNPLEAFQDALKQALCKDAHTIPIVLLNGCSGQLKSSIQHDQTYTGNTPSSSRTKDDCEEEGRGRRKRKAKIHFDELAFLKQPITPRKTRCLRIMRQLGLAPPAGSPFTISPRRKV